MATRDSVSAARVEPAPVRIRRAGIAVMAAALWFGSGSIVEAQKAIRIGASVSQTGTFASLGQNQLRGYRLCVKYTNERGGVLGRPLELIQDDDQSEPANAASIYERLITQEHVDLVLGPYGSPNVEAVASVIEKHRIPTMSPSGGTTSIFKKGRKFIFQVISPAEVYLEGLIDMAARRGLRTLAVLYEDTLLTRAIAQGTLALAKKRGLEAAVVEAYPRGTTDFSALLGKVRAASPEVLAAATYFDDALAITRQARDLNVNPKMYALTVGAALPRFYEMLGRAAEFVYVPSQWEPELVELRAGGLIPIARQYPGAKEFVEAHRREYPGADLSYQTTAGYAACQVLVEAVKRAGSLDRDKIRNAILKLDFHTVFGAFKVDPDGLQIAHKMVVFQWQDGKKVIVWPDELSPIKPRFPTPPWSQR